jgi:hypothetical protein
MVIRDLNYTIERRDRSILALTEDKNQVEVKAKDKVAALKALAKTHTQASTKHIKTMMIADLELHINDQVNKMATGPTAQQLYCDYW